jgi:hypothetical protein
MDWVVAAAAIGFLGVIGLITGALAARKGYAFVPWIFAGGIIGLMVLAFLPFANDPELSEFEQRKRATRGNDIGRKIAIVSLIIGLLRIMALS